MVAVAFRRPAMPWAVAGIKDLSVGVRRQDTQSALVVPRTSLLEAELIDLT